MKLREFIESIKQFVFLVRPGGNCYIGRTIDDNRMKLVTRYTDDMVFHCEYDVISHGNKFVTSSVFEAIKWFNS